MSHHVEVKDIQMSSFERKLKNFIERAGRATRIIQLFAKAKSGTPGHCGSPDRRENSWLTANPPGPDKGFEALDVMTTDHCRNGNRGD